MPFFSRNKKGKKNRQAIRKEKKNVFSFLLIPPLKWTHLGPWRISRGAGEEPPGWTPCSGLLPAPPPLVHSSGSGRGFLGL